MVSSKTTCTNALQIVWDQHLPSVPASKHPYFGVEIWDFTDLTDPLQVCTTCPTASSHEPGHEWSVPAGTEMVLHTYLVNI